MKTEIQKVVQLTLTLTPEEAQTILDNDWDKSRPEPTRPGKILYSALVSAARQT